MHHDAVGEQLEGDIASGSLANGRVDGSAQIDEARFDRLTEAGAVDVQRWHGNRRTERPDGRGAQLQLAVWLCKCAADLHRETAGRRNLIRGEPDDESGTRVADGENAGHPEASGLGDDDASDANNGAEGPPPSFPDRQRRLGRRQRTG